MEPGKESDLAIAGLAGLATTAIMGVVALINELALDGTIKPEALDRISEFMLGAIENSGAAPAVQAQLTASLTKQFADLRRRMG